VINTNLLAILYRLRDIAFEMSKIAILGYPFAFKPPDGKVPLERSPKNFPRMSMDGRGTKQRRKIAKRRQTDGR